jgi:hypothetical protein
MTTIHQGLKASHVHGLKARKVTALSEAWGKMRTIHQGLKARNVTARPGGPGEETCKIIPALKGRHHARLSAPPLSRPYRAGGYWGRDTRAFSLGYHMAGLQPASALDAESDEVLARIGPFRG